MIDTFKEGRIIMNDNVISVDDINFQKEVLKSDKPVLVDFWASWCNPCRMVSPIIEQIANEYKNDLKVVKVNVDENNELASQYDIMSIPSFGFKDICIKLTVWNESSFF